MQNKTETHATIPQHLLDQMENEWRQVRAERENPRPAQQQEQPQRSEA